MEKLGSFVKRSPLPIIVKEVGAGIDSNTFQSIVGKGVAAIDIAGKGGTSWPYIEGLRSTNEQTSRLGKVFRDWGLPTAVNLEMLQSVLKEKRSWKLIVSGGIRDGITVLKALELGADFVGIGLPLFQAALEAKEKPSKKIEMYKGELRVAMLGVGRKKVVEDGDNENRIYKTFK